MRFFELVTLTIALMEREGQITYRGLQREFALDDALLEDLRAELILARGVAADLGGRLLVSTSPAGGPRAALVVGSQSFDDPKVVVMVVVVAIVGLLFLMPLSRVLARDWGPPGATTTHRGRR